MAIFKGTSKAEVLNGTEAADTIKAGGGDDTLNGLGGNDVLDGGTGADTMTGGAGNDTYFIDNIADKAIESSGGGIDTVRANISYTLAAQIEKLYLTGSGAIDGTGNDLANSMTGNTAVNTLTGLGGNDTLNGGPGADTMIGGTGNDTYVVDNVGDKVTEALGEGIDLVKASVTYTLSGNIERLTLGGTGAIDGTGNELANTLLGNAASNVLNGLGGADKIDGGIGADAMNGGAGDDVYFVDNAGDTIGEGFGQGTDTVNTAISYTLAANVENLLLTGSAAANATGSSVANILTGNDAANTLDGGAGADTLIGGLGTDVLIGGAGLDTTTGGDGDDTFVFTLDGIASKTSSGADTIVDFTLGDKIDISQIDAQVQASGYGQPGDQAFVFIGQNRIHNHTGGELRYEVSGGNTYVYGEFNGDTNPDFCIKLIGVHTLTAGDFIL